MNGLPIALLRMVAWLILVACVGCAPNLRTKQQDICEQRASPNNPFAVQKPGLGGTGAVAGRPGLGGTGLTDGGIGGTGIVGVVTGFASICVNGVEVHFDADTPVSDNGEPSAAQQLAVGQVVVVRAAGAGAQVKARNIVLAHAAVGPVEALDAVTGDFRLLGQRARALDLGNLAGMKVGDWVKVGGHRMADGLIAASRVEPVTAQAHAQLLGTVGQVQAGSFSVEGVRVSMAAHALPSGLVAGREVLVGGQWDGNTLLAQRVDLDPTWNGLGQVESVLLEGFVHALGAGQLIVGQSHMALGQNVQIEGPDARSLALNQHVTVSGRVGANRSIVVDRVEISRGSGFTGGAGSRSSRRESGPRGSGGSGSSGSGSSGSGSTESESSGSGSSGSGSSGSGSSGSGSSGGGSGGGSGGESSGSGKN